MFHYIKGNVTEKFNGGIVLETGGVGFEIFIPSRSKLFMAEPQDSVKVYTYMAVREDDISLYGFDDRAGLDIFKMLTAVSGVGNKAAMSILSALSPLEIRRAIAFDDASMFVKAQGIGKKTASRIVLELKDKIDIETVENGFDMPASPSADLPENLAAVEDAVSALMALGFSRNEAADAVRTEGKDCATAEEYIRKALRKLSMF